MYGCGYCRLPIGGLVERIRCDGCCQKEFHMTCTTLNTFDVRRCNEQRNVLWMCDDCLRSYRKQRTDSRSEKETKAEDEHHNIEVTVGQLQSEVAKIKESIEGLQTSLNCSRDNRPINTLPSSSTPLRNAFPDRNATTCDSDRSLMMGSRLDNSSMDSPRKYWIFFTRVAKHVSTDAIRGMVCRSLQLKHEPDVIKLLPRWGNIENLRYVSFKVGVDWCYKEKATEESTWPAGLLFREFVRYESSYWEP